MTPMTKNLGRTLRSLLPLAAGAAIAVTTLYPLAANQHAAAAQQSAAATTAKSASSAKPYVVPDLAERVAKFKLVHMPFNSAGLTAREKQMVAKLVDASGLLDCIYWRQNDPEGLKLYLSLAKSKNPQDELLRRYLKINGSRFDLIDDEKPFVGTRPAPPGRGFYPEDLTREQVEAYVAAHPQQKNDIYNAFTIIRRKGDALEAVPYHVAYQEFLVPMAKELREAAEL